MILLFTDYRAVQYGSETMGIGSSHPTKLEREFGGLGDGNGEERFFGLENFGNTCYCNSVLQARCRVSRSACVTVVSILHEQGYR